MMKKHMVKRSLSYLALTGMLACASDPTGDFRTGVDELQATPAALFVQQDSTKNVVVLARDAAGNPVEANFTISNVGTGITVVRDESFEPIRNEDGDFVPNPRPTRVRYLVTATNATAATSFVITAGGKNTTVTVRNVPNAGSLPTATVGVASPAIGATTSLTLPAPYRFTSASAISFSGSTLTGVNRVLSADSSSVTFFAPPGLNASTATVNNVVLSYAPTLQTFTVTSGGTFTTATPLLTVAPLAGVAGDTITVTAPTGFRFTPGTTGNSVPTIPGAGNAIVSYAADSSSMRFLIGPSANGPVSVTNLRYTGTEFAPFTLTSGTNNLVTPAVTSFGATFSTATPAMNQSVTITAASGFRFLPTSSVTVGGVIAPVIARSADSTAITIAPAPTGAAAAAPTVTGVVLAFLRTVSLTLPTTGTITPAAPVALAGADAFATAPTVVYPAIGSAAVLYDAGANGSVAQCTAVGGASACRIYRFTVAVPTRFSFTARWAGTADIGIYWMDGTGAPGTLFCDAFGSGAGGQPETCAGTFAAGTYYFASIQYGGAAPAWRGLQVVATAP